MSNKKYVIKLKLMEKLLGFENHLSRRTYFIDFQLGLKILAFNNIPLKII